MVTNMYMSIYDKDLLSVHFSEVLDVYLNNCILPFEPLFYENESMISNTSEEFESFSNISPSISEEDKEEIPCDSSSSSEYDTKFEDKRDRNWNDIWSVKNQEHVNLKNQTLDTQEIKEIKEDKKKIDRSKVKRNEKSYRHEKEKKREERNKEKKREERNKEERRTKRDFEVKVDTLKNFRKHDLGIPFRSGAILYTKCEGKTYFCLGLDTVYGELTDFAGGVKKDEDIISGGLRELKEESFGVFGNIKYEDIKDCLGVYCSNMLIMFLPVKVDMNSIKKMFNERVTHHRDNHYRGEIEVSSITWIEKTNFLKIIEGSYSLSFPSSTNGKLYQRVQRMLYHVRDTISNL